MKQATAGPWLDIVERARWAPTPHNTQAYRLHTLSDTKTLVVYDPARAIPETDPQGQFLYVGLGIFAENMRLCAAALGYALDFSLDATAGQPVQGYKTLGTMTLQQDAIQPDINPELIMKRRTSRLPFDGTPVDPSVKEKLQAETSLHGQELGFSDKPEDIAAVLRFNTKILFHDLNHTGLRRELAAWIRWRKRDYTVKQDGFSVAALNQNALLMWVFMHTYWLLKLPLIQSWVQRRYERAISGVATIGWIKGPFNHKQDWVNAGVCLARIWLKTTEVSVYIHPFGSVITNEEARSWALQQLELKEEPGQMCWLLFRIGSGPEPPRSLRHETKEYFV